MGGGQCWPKQCRQIHISMQICRDCSCGGDPHRQLLVVSVVRLPIHTACGTALSREDSKIWWVELKKDSWTFRVVEYQEMWLLWKLWRRNRTEVISALFAICHHPFCSFSYQDVSKPGLSLSDICCSVDFPFKSCERKTAALIRKYFILCNHTKNNNIFKWQGKTKRSSVAESQTWTFSRKMSFGMHRISV